MAHPLKKYREDRKLSRKELADKLDCAASYIGHLENEIRTISPELAMKWEKRCGIPKSLLRPDLWPS